jgi:hypothetical protein
MREEFGSFRFCAYIKEKLIYLNFQAFRQSFNEREGRDNAAIFQSGDIREVNSSTLRKFELSQAFGISHLTETSSELRAPLVGPAVHKFPFFWQRRNVAARMLRR